ncbi:hypothetical protein [Mangrovimonas aestuarii]|uniref:hypothetical protein n=1 Tax=Mangrovimonas aestuarii TaxID=3018443 RepID=UPI0023794C44|nr:hypothetical protein [Mangrovimonas aestuarii]
MSTNFFNQRERKRFNYNPRFSEEEEESTLGNSGENDNSISSFEVRWNRARRSVRGKTRKGVSLPILFITLVLVLVVMYYLSKK